MLQMIKVMALAVLLLAGAVPQVVLAQSFDCHEAETDTEWAICNTPDLGKLDVEMASTYHQAMTDAAQAPQRAQKIERMQSSWIIGQRDLCDGDVGCLTNAYNSILAALNALPPAADAATPAGEPALAPLCQAAASEASADVFDQVLCGNPDLLATAQKIDALAGELDPKLPASWRTAFMAEQAAFSGMANNCASDEPALTQCVAKALNQRLQDVQDLAANLASPVPDCAPSDVSIKDSQNGDAGMSQTLDVYLIEYQGNAACQIRGYPTLSVAAAADGQQTVTVTYSGRTYFSTQATPPLPVRLSPQSKTAWFAIHSAHACDPNGSTIAAQVALPLSQTWLRTLDYADPTCPVLTVTPVGTMSMLSASVM